MSIVAVVNNTLKAIINCHVCVEGDMIYYSSVGRRVEWTSRRTAFSWTHSWKKCIKNIETLGEGDKNEAMRAWCWCRCAFLLLSTGSVYDKNSSATSGVSDDRLTELGRPRLGEVMECTVNIRESQEFKVNKRINSVLFFLSLSLSFCLSHSLPPSSLLSSN